MNQLESDESERGRSDAGGDGGNLSGLGETNERYDDAAQHLGGIGGRYED